MTDPTTPLTEVERDALRYPPDDVFAAVERIKADAYAAGLAARGDAATEAVERVRALADEWEVAGQRPMPQKAPTESERDQGVRIGVWHSVQTAARELRAALDASPAPREATCARLVSSIHEDEDVHPCGKPAVAEVFSIHGRWEPACEYHAAGIPADRSRSLTDPAPREATGCVWRSCSATEPHEHRGYDPALREAP